MKLLGVETSSPIFSVALWDGDRMAASERADGQGRPSLLLADMIEKTARAGGASLERLDGFALSIGPGSFTGLRVGVMTVKTLAWALKKPVLPVSSLEVLAQNLREAASDVCPFVDARKGKVYTSLFRPDGSRGLRRAEKDRLLPPEEALRRLDAGQTILIGDGLARYKELVASLDGRVRQADPAAWIPSAGHLCRLAAGRWPHGAVDAPHRLVPQYIYSQESDITGW